MKQGIFRWNHQISLDVEDSISFATGHENFLKLRELKDYEIKQKNGETFLKDSSFGKIPARKIKKYHYDDFIRTLTNGTIVYSYVCQIKSIFSQAFDYACDREIMSWNFMRSFCVVQMGAFFHTDYTERKRCAL